MQTTRTKPDFVVQFMEVFDCPGVDGKSRSNIYLRAVLWRYQSIVIRQGPPVSKPECISDIVFTPIRTDCRSAIYHSYRNLHANPPDDAFLVVQVFHATSDSPKPEMDTLLGKTEIPMAYLQTEDVFTHPMIPIRSSDRSTCLNFAVKLRRAFLHGAPPKRKTFFLVRHGQSKWNLAQSRINIAGMLDKDHALTELGIRQAQQLNSRWRFHFFKEGENFSTVPTGAPSKGKGGSSNAESKRGTPTKALAPPQPPAAVATADLLDLDSFEATATPSNSDPFSGVTSVASNGALDDLFASVAVAPVPPSKSPTPPPSGTAPDTEVWSTDDVRQHLQRLESTIEDSPDDYRAGILDDSDVGDSDVDEADDDVFAPRHNLTDEFVSGVPIPQASKTELADKFNHADVKLVDEFSGRVNQDLVEQRRQEYMKLFLHADAIYSSPLTRALQTAILTMNGHPATKTYGITLMSTIREVKRIGGLDTVGVACGEAIESRLRSELAMILGAEEADRLVTFPIDFNDANLPWWTPLADHESEQQQQDRVREFLTFLRHCDAQIPVFVGHSLFFRAFYSKRVSSHLLKNRRKLSENLKKFLLSNATMLAVTVNFTDYSLGGGLSEAVMIDADIIFGGGFHGAEHDDDGGHGVEHGKYSKGSAQSNGKPSAKDSLTGFITGISQKAVVSLSNASSVLGKGSNGASSNGSNNSGSGSSSSSSSGAPSNRDTAPTSGTSNATGSGQSGSAGTSFGSGTSELFGFFSQDAQKQLQRELESGRQAATKTMKKWSSAVKDFLDT